MIHPLLHVDQLTTAFSFKGRLVPAVRSISFKVAKGECVGLVGESGCGKSVTSLSIMRLIPSNGQIVEGRISFDGQDLAKLPMEAMRKVRGNKISMIFQEPMTSLNPVFTVGNQICEVLKIHRGLRGRQAEQQALKLLTKVRIPEPKRRLREYPHQLSGGMRQRIMIAMALACEPELLIADEPTTALDVTIQAQILELLADLRSEVGMAVLMITHDLGVVAEFCDRVMVMYGGRIVEEALVEDLFEHPQHPYTRGLLRSVPRIGRRIDKLPTIEGTVPPLGELPQGCAFQNRCPEVHERCRKNEPKLIAHSQSTRVACFARTEVAPNE